jgi:hypothetical protein
MRRLDPSRGIEHLRTLPPALRAVTVHARRRLDGRVVVTIETGESYGFERALEIIRTCASWCPVTKTWVTDSDAAAQRLFARVHQQGATITLTEGEPA